MVPKHPCKESTVNGMVCVYTQGCSLLTINNTGLLNAILAIVPSLAMCLPRITEYCIFTRDKRWFLSCSSTNLFSSAYSASQAARCNCVSGMEMLAKFSAPIPSGVVCNTNSSNTDDGSATVVIPALPLVLGSSAACLLT